MSLLKGVKGIYFDLDDTLCGYWEAAKGGLRRAFEVHPIPGRSLEESLEAWADSFHEFCPGVKKSGWYNLYLSEGGSTRTELMRLTLRNLDAGDDTLADRLSQTYAEERDNALSLFPDAVRILERLHGNIPLGLITNGPADVQRQEVRTLKIEKYFDHIFIEGEQGIGKPHEQVFQRAEAAMGLQPDDLLMVGNSYAHDIKAALCCGWRAVWVRRDTDVPPSSRTGRPEDLPEDAIAPTMTVESLDDLSQALSI